MEIRNAAEVAVRRVFLKNRGAAWCMGTMVPLAGIEPALLAELDFESSASTSSATGALSAVAVRPRREAGGL